MPYSPIQENLTLFAYEDWPLVFSIVDESGAVKNLTSATAVWVLKRGGPRGAELLRKTTAALGGITNGGAAGTLAVDVTEVETQDFRAGAYYHELNITLSGVTRKASYGSVTVQATGIRS